MQLYVRQDGADALLAIKAVPGASRNQVAGLLGDRLKIRVHAPPEGGKANRAICAILARELGVKKNRISIESGASSAEKVVRIKNLATAQVIAILQDPV